MARDRETLQMAGSLIVAVIIVMVTIAVVTAKVGPDGDELLEERERREEDDSSGRGSFRTDRAHRRLALANGRAIEL
jgi:hypothetical protein